MSNIAIKIYKVVRYTVRNGKRRHKDQVLYETVKHAMHRTSYYRDYYEFEVFAAKPFINSNDELELAWAKLSSEDIQAMKDQLEAERLDKKRKKS